MHFRSAVATDLAAIEALLDANELPTVGVAEHLTNFIVGVGPSGTIACGGVEYYAEFALMRSIAVARDARGFGLGEAIIAHLLAACRTRAVRSVVLLTTTAEHYFADQGFAPVARNEVPPALLASNQFRGVCPASATTMLKVLKVDEADLCRSTWTKRKRGDNNVLTEDRNLQTVCRVGQLRPTVRVCRGG